MSDLIDQISKDLPNFPQDIIEQWLGYYAQFDGWPPSYHPNGTIKGNWASLLLGRPLEYWKGISWCNVSVTFNNLNFNAEVLLTINQIIAAHLTGEVNLYSIYMNGDNKSRFNSIMSHIIENGDLPKKPILIHDKDGYEICDGMHRAAALMLFCDPKYSALKNRYLLNIDIKPVPLKDKILVWVGYP